VAGLFVEVPHQDAGPASIGLGLLRSTGVEQTLAGHGSPRRMIRAGEKNAARARAGEDLRGVI